VVVMGRLGIGSYWLQCCAKLLAAGLLLALLPACSGWLGSNPERTHGTDPGTIDTGLPLPSALKNAGFTPVAASCCGAEYVAAGTFPRQKVEAAEDCCVFSPDWTAADPAPEGLAYACYAFDMAGYTGAQRFTFGWDQAGALGGMWIGIADFKHDAWDWRELPATNQLAFDFTPYIDSETHTMLVLPLAMGQAPWKLDSIHIGDLVRMTGQVWQADGVTPLYDAEIVLTGARTYTARTDDTGKWNIRGVAPGSYAVTANLIGWEFTPGARNILARDPDQEVAVFHGAALAGHAAAGSITGDIGGEQPIGAQLTIKRQDSPYGAISIWADYEGNWSIELPDGDYTAAPELLGWAFSPAAVDFRVAGGEVAVPALHAEKLPGYVLDGYVFQTDGVTPLAGVQINVALPGHDAIFSAATDASGYWAIPDITDGVYTLEPQLTGWRFTPQSQQVTINGAAQRAAAFIATELPRCTVSGNVFMADGVTPLSGISVMLSGEQGWVYATTNSAGRYVFEAVYTGAYSVSPQSALFTFAPEARSVHPTADYAVDPFLATAVPVYKISGHVLALDGVTGVAGVELKVFAYLPVGTSFTTTTGADGAWELRGIPDGHFTVLPAKQGCIFDPPERAIDVQGADLVVPFFTGSALPAYALGGYVYQPDGVTPVAGVAVLVSGGMYSYEALTGADGHWQVDEALEDTYSITPMLAPWKFTPALREVQVSGAGVVADPFIGEQLPAWTVEGYMYETGSTTPVPDEQVWFYGDGLNYRCITDAGGHYSLLLPNGAWSVQPQSTCWSFDPTAQEITMSGAAQTLAAFYATPGG
jgi:hypothetical protein